VGGHAQHARSGHYHYHFSELAVGLPDHQAIEGGDANELVAGVDHGGGLPAVDLAQCLLHSDHRHHLVHFGRNHFQDRFWTQPLPRSFWTTSKMAERGSGESRCDESNTRARPPHEICGVTAQEFNRCPALYGAKINVRHFILRFSSLYKSFQAQVCGGVCSVAAQEFGHI
jgi:hypothetical protein